MFYKAWSPRGCSWTGKNSASPTEVSEWLQQGDGGVMKLEIMTE